MRLSLKPKLKPLILTLMLLVGTQAALGQEECKGTVTLEEVPCLTLLPLNQSSTACSTVSVQFYKNATSLYTQQMGTYSPVVCNGTFDPSRNNSGSALGTYTFQYSTGDSGSIIVEAGFMEILLWFFAILGVIGLLVFGFSKEDSIVLSLAGFLLIVMGVFMIINGFSIFLNTITNAISYIMFGLGGYIIIKSNMESLQS